ncbi:MAG: AAA family ATPase [Thermoplasmata archaeon]|nr:AAA family ATPase [Thermoplasmata archaeon]
MVKEDMFQMERISTGIKEFDSLIEGGYPKNRTILLSGGPGVGKTIAALQYVNKVCESGKKCLYLATEETPEELRIQANQLGIPLKTFEDNNLLKIEPVLAERMEDIQWQRGKTPSRSILKKPIDSISNSDADSVVLDNLGSYTLDITIGTFREQLDLIVHTVRKKGMSGLFVSDETLNERYNSVALYSVHGAIHMFKRENPFTGNVERLMNVMKMRGTKTPLGYVKYIIDENGINIQSSKTSK